MSRGGVLFDKESTLEQIHGRGRKGSDQRPNIFTEGIHVDVGGDGIFLGVFNHDFEVGLEDVGEVEEEVTMVTNSPGEDVLDKVFGEVFVVEETANEGAHEGSSSGFFRKEVGVLVEGEKGTNHCCLDGGLGGGEVGEGDTEKRSEVFMEPGD